MTLGASFLKLQVIGSIMVIRFETIVKGILAAPPKATPPSNKGLIRPYFLGGVALGGVVSIPITLSPSSLIQSFLAIRIWLVGG